ncbi:MAG: magnesium/cobalt transporter CorA [Salinispira sp.]
MAKYISTKQIDIDSIPGSLPETAGNQVSVLNCIEWTKNYCAERVLASYRPEEWNLNPKCLHWVNIVGNNRTALESIASYYGIHPLTIEDIANDAHAPKYEDHPEYSYMIVKMLSLDGDLIVAEQLNIIITRQCVITIQEVQGDVFDQIRRRLRDNLGRARQMGTDYLVFSMLDATIDHYILTIETLGEQVEIFEDEIFRYHDEYIIRFVRKLKRDFAEVRRFTRPVIGIIEQILKSDHRIIQEASYPFYQDLRDQIRQVRDAVDSYREMLSDQLGLYAALQGNRMNEIMKVLAIISTVFIPLTFISGVYGMNFQNMPELNIPWVYPLVLFVMLAIAAGLGLFFRLKGWIGRKGRRKKRSSTVKAKTML